MNQIQNVLEDTLNQMFSSDISLNNLFRMNSRMFDGNEETKEDTSSMPDLIPIQEEPNSYNRSIQLWSTILEDYHSQMRMYQENVKRILDITQPMLTRPVQPVNTNTNIWTDYFRNILPPRATDYVFDFDRIIPTTQTEDVTETFIYDISNNQILYQTCPISLEEFRDGDSLTRILYCGHIFKTDELTRWFTRNTHCPTCRHDIR
jgi:hypothetical protein